MAANDTTFKWYGHTVSKRIAQIILRNAKVAAIHLENEVTKTLNNTGTGRRYKIYYAGVAGTRRAYSRGKERTRVKGAAKWKWHTASAAGSPPAPLTRRLMKIGHKVIIKKDYIRVLVGHLKAVPYARLMEFGGMAGRKKRAKIEPRPYLRPTLRREKDAVLTIINRP